MTQEKIKENDRLIGEFMMLGLPKNFPKIWKEFEKLDYHKSWDWLMPVVEKIETIKLPIHERFIVQVSTNSCTIEAKNLWKYLKGDEYYNGAYFNQVVEENKFNSVYKAVLQFIKWYNEQKSN